MSFFSSFLPFLSNIFSLLTFILPLIVVAGAAISLRGGPFVARIFLLLPLVYLPTRFESEYSTLFFVFFFFLLCALFVYLALTKKILESVLILISCLTTFVEIALQGGGGHISPYIHMVLISNLLITLTWAHILFAMCLSCVEKKLISFFRTVV